MTFEENCEKHILKLLVLVAVLISVIVVLLLFRLDDYIQVLLREINLDYCRTANQTIFDLAVTCNPAMFSFVTLPEKVFTPVPASGNNCQISCKRFLKVKNIFLLLGTGLLQKCKNTCAKIPVLNCTWSCSRSLNREHFERDSQTLALCVHQPSSLINWLSCTTVVVTVDVNISSTEYYQRST